MNDLHGQEDLSGLYNAAKEHDVFVKSNNIDGFKLQSGDSIAGQSEKSASLLVHFFNHIGLDFGNLGNHEFDLKISTLSEMLKRANYKVFATNLDIEDESPLKKLVYKSYVAQKNGNKYGFLGIQPFELKSVVNNKEAFRHVEVEDFEDTVEEIQEQVQKLKKQGVNKIILLSHVGLSNDKKLAKSLEGVDLIIGGHSHDIVEGVKEGENLFYSRKGEPVAVVQAGRDGKNYGILDVTFNENGIITNIDNKIFNTKREHNLLTEYLGRKLIGDSPVIGAIKEIDKIPEKRLIESYGYANLICDVMKDALGVDVAFVNAGNIRYVPSSGEITERMIEKSTPFKNNLVKTTVSEKEIVEALKFGAKSLTNPDNFPGLLHVAGLKYEIDSRGRLLSASILEKDGSYTTLNINNPTNRQYSVVYDDFLANGKEYPVFSIASKEAQHFDFDKDALLKEFFKKQREPFAIKNDGRLKICSAQAKSTPITPMYASSSASAQACNPVLTIAAVKNANVSTQAQNTLTPSPFVRNPVARTLTITPMQAFIEARRQGTYLSPQSSNSMRNLAKSILTKTS